MYDHKLVAKKSKCLFGQNKLEYLGHVISQEGVSTDPSKISAMKNWPLPTSIKQLRGFIGLTGYYRRFIKSYGEISRPLMQLLKKGSFQWSQAATEAFTKLKQAMITSPVLALPDYSIPFVVETDASDQGVGAVLMQQGRPIAYFSKGLSNKHQGLSTYEKELLAIVLATQKWNYYLQGNHFVIKTDHQSLKFLLEQRLSTLLQQKWLSNIIGFDYEIVYKTGAENKVADALSRLPENKNSGTLLQLTTSCNNWLGDLVKSYEGDNEVQTILAGIAAQDPQYSLYQYSKGVLKLHERLYVGSQGNMRTTIMWELHDSPQGGHSGQEATVKRVCQSFFWSKMKEEIQEYVRSCDICQRIKTGQQLPGGLLQPLPIPSQVWQDISLDFVEGLPRSQEKDCIIVVIDRLSKMGHFIALSHPFSALTIAQAFLDNIYKLHGMP